MASLAAACRATARGVGRRATARGFSTSSRCLAAHNFIMPALSPTMTEGNIASWKVKDGETFSAGDVLLEIETDKATMDVEAQDDGVMMKVLAADGSKSVQVGARIAVIADPGDDVASLEMPADEQPKAQSQPKPQAPAAAEPAAESSPPTSSPRRDGDEPPAARGHARQQTYPLMPSVEHLVRQNGLSEDDVRAIKPTGPGGRLLKGDVLAHLGTIKADAPAAVSSRFESLARLDLSNIKVAAAKAPAPKSRAEQPPPPPLELSVPVSLAKVVEVQGRIRESLGVFLPLSTFISRAAEVANDDLPAAARPPTAAELFDQVLGLDKVKAATGSRGVYLPQISAIPPASMLAPPRHESRAADIIDELAGGPRRPKAVAPRAAVPAVPGLSSGANVFTLVVPKEEEKRAQAFLERCKLILEEEPGRLVL